MKALCPLVFMGEGDHFTNCVLDCKREADWMIPGVFQEKTDPFAGLFGTIIYLTKME